MSMNLVYDIRDISIFGDYLDKIKESLIASKQILNTEFYRNNHLVLSKILFLAYQKGLAQNELFDLMNYIPTNEKVVELVYDYKGYTNYNILIRAVDIIFNVKIIEDGENYVGIQVEQNDVREQQIFHAELDENSQRIPLIYNEELLTSLLLGNQLPTLVISFIKLFLPVGIQLNIEATANYKAEILKAMEIKNPAKAKEIKATLKQQNKEKKEKKNERK